MSQGVSTIGTCMSFSEGAPATIGEDGFSAKQYSESGEITNIGDVGAENEVITYNTVCDGTVNKRLGATNYGQQALTLAWKSSNAAQAILANAAKTKEQISVRVNLSSGDVFYYVAYVSMFKAQPGGSSDYLRASVSLEVDSEIIEVAP